MVVALYRLIKDLPVPNDKLFVSTYIYKYQIHFLYSLSAFHTGETGYKYFVKLFNSPQLNLTNQFNNYRFYYPVPVGIAVNFTTTHVLEGEEFLTSSPSILALGDNYIMNIRLVNYKIREDGTYTMKSKSITTKNKLVVLNKAFEVIKPPLYPTTDIVARGLPNSPYKYTGIEDVKLANIEGKIHYTGTICLATHQIGVCYGIYDEIKLTPTELVPLQGCEKNWVFLPNQKKNGLRVVPSTFWSYRKRNFKIG